MDSVAFWKDRWIRKPTFSGAMEKTYEAIKVRFLELEKDKTATLDFSNKTILDLGCGRGEILSWLATEKGCTVMGVEIGKAPVEYLKNEGYEVVCEDVRTVSLEKKFNIVLCCFVLQHMMEEVDVMSLYEVILLHLEDKGMVVLVDKFTSSNDVKDFNAFCRPLSFHQEIWRRLGLVLVKRTPLIEGKVDPCKFIIVLQKRKKGRKILCTGQKISCLVDREETKHLGKA